MSTSTQLGRTYQIANALLSAIGATQDIWFIAPEGGPWIAGALMERSDLGFMPDPERAKLVAEKVARVAEIHPDPDLAGLPAAAQKLADAARKCADRWPSWNGVKHGPEASGYLDPSFRGALLAAASHVGLLLRDAERYHSFEFSSLEL